MTADEIRKKYGGFGMSDDVFTEIAAQLAEQNETAKAMLEYYRRSVELSEYLCLQQKAEDIIK